MSIGYKRFILTRIKQRRETQIPTTDEQIAFIPKDNMMWKKYPSDRGLRRRISGYSHSAWHLLPAFRQLSPPSITQGCWVDTELAFPLWKVQVRLNVPLKGQRLSDALLEHSHGQPQPRLRRLHSTALPSRPNTVLSPEHKPLFSLVLAADAYDACPNAC